MIFMNIYTSLRKYLEFLKVLVLLFQRLREQNPEFVYITHSENGTQFAHI